MMRRISAVVATLCSAGALLAIAPGGAAARTVWLCRPHSEPNPCRESLETTVYSLDGSSRVARPALARGPKFDCFYVYPTVSGQPTLNSDRAIEAEQISIAEYQAGRFSRVCRVYAPVYRQLTLAGITTATPEQLQAGAALAYGDVRAAWREYLRRYNKGRGVVLIGHSQGTFMLRTLIRRQIDRRPAVRERLISAILLGGDVAVKRGRRSGGDFGHVPTCASRRETGCAIAYSTFGETPPSDARFGMPPAGRFALPSGPDLEVACTNPARLRGGTGALKTIARTEPFPGALGVALQILYGGQAPTAPTPWIVPPARYTGHCVHAGGAHVLTISPIGDSRPLNPSPDATWGLHLADVNIALGNLIAVVRAQGRAFLSSP